MSVVLAAGGLVEIRLLGPVQVRTGAGEVDAGPLQQRAVLAALAVDAGRPVMVSTLVERVWDQEPPAGARSALYSYISRLRRLLAEDHPPGRGADASGGVLPAIRLVGRGSGYLLDVDPQVTDLHRFRQLVAAARATDRDDVRRAELLDQALRLWSGPPLADLPGPWAARMRTGWQQERLDVTVQWAHTRLRLGCGGEVIGPVRSLLEEHPLSEPLAEVLIRALVAAGRDAEALEYYAATRARLGEELGVEPGPALRAVHQALLRGELDRAPLSEVSAETATSQAVSVPRSEPAALKPGVPGTGLAGAGGPPRQLPREASCFTGRSAELEQLLELVPGPGDATAVVVSAIDGMAGIGKTALAVYTAHRMVDRFPDGQLFIDLHGYTQGLAPIEPAEALDRLLRDLGVPGTQIPTGLDARAALYRTRLADRQMLIVLDNAATETQVAPLLPGTAGCLVLVTSRRRLAGLDHTQTLSLDTLPAADAVALFTSTAGESRLADQPPELVAEVVDLCGRLPLAIRIAAARLRSRPVWHLGDLVRRLRDQQHRLGELAAGQRSVTAALDLSYHDLSADQQQAYQLLGLHPGPEFDTHATAALLDSTLLHASRVLDQLLEAHLLQEPTPGRYRFHDLTRAHAACSAIGDPTSPATVAALGRLLDYYRHTSSTAMDTAYPYDREHRPQVPPAHTPSPELTDPAAALAWLDTELPNLLAAARYATGHTRPEHPLHLLHLLHLSTILHRHLLSRGRYHDAESLHHQTLTTARAAGGQAGQLTALNGLGDIHRFQGRYKEATDHHEEALRIARATGHRNGELNALTGLGWIHRRQGRYGQAVHHHEQALQIAHATGNHPAELDALNGLGHIHLMQGHYGQAAHHHEQALQIARATGNHPAELTALNGLGHIHLMQGRNGQAAHHNEQALRIARATGHRPGELNALTGLGHIHLRRGQYGQAADRYGQALRIAHATGHRPGELTALTGLGQVYRRLGRHYQATALYQQLLGVAQLSGDRNYEFEAWQGLGRLSHATGHPDAAIAYHTQALTLAGELSQPDDRARAHDGLAHAHHALHQREQARSHWQYALDLLIRFGIDHTDDEETTAAAIRAHLTTLAEPEPTPDVTG
jgi:DNA-binding SARP family transcriptional activator/tetratricopeptide (TPR) repeat protein